MVVLTRSMAAKRKRSEFELPHDVVVEIAGHVAASSPRPMDDLTSIRATCKAMRTACSDPGVARRVALEKEAAMKWHETGRYHTLVQRLARVGNPEACFTVGFTLIFAHRRARQGAAWLGRAAAAGHKTAAYVLGLLLYRAAASHVSARDTAMRYIAQVEGDDDESSTKKKTTNRECSRCRDHAMAALREITWTMAAPRGRVETALPEDGHRCTAKGCGMPEGWSGDAVFCSDQCRIRHEYVAFFSLVSLPVS